MFLTLAVALGLLAISSAVPALPTAALEVDDASPFVGERVRFDASESRPHDEGNGRIVAYRFDFGDGTTSGWQSSPRAEHAYESAGQLEATVTVRDGRDLEDRASVTIGVRGVPPPTGDAPDLTPIQAGVDPARPEVGDVVRVAVTILNVGGSAAEEGSVRILDERPAAGTIEIGIVALPEAVAPGAMTVILSPGFLAVEEGPHTLRILVEGVVPAETYRENNALAVPVEVEPAGTPGDGTEPSGFDPGPWARGLAVAAGLSLVAALLLLRRPRELPPRGPLAPGPKERSPPPIWPP